jgi:DNA-binding NarL/FixJ family response regulator
VAIKVLVADDSDVVRMAIRRTLEEDARIEVVGEASTFAETMQLIGDCQPSVLLLDLHLPEKRDFTPAFVKSQLAGVAHTLAVSFSNDPEAKALADSYGATALLDKVNLYTQMIPAIMRCCSSCTEPHVAMLVRRTFQSAAPPRNPIPTRIRFEDGRK